MLIKGMGHVQRGAVRCLIVAERPVSTAEIMEWAFPRAVHSRDRHRRKDMARAIRRAALSIGLEQVGRVWPDGLVWD